MLAVFQVATGLIIGSVVAIRRKIKALRHDLGTSELKAVQLQLQCQSYMNDLIGCHMALIALARRERPEMRIGLDEINAINMATTHITCNIDPITQDRVFTVQEETVQ